MSERGTEGDLKVFDVDAGRRAAFGRVTARLRTAMLMSVDELAYRLDVSVRLVKKIEEGKKEPGLTLIWAYANSLGIGFDELARLLVVEAGGPTDGLGI